MTHLDRRHRPGIVDLMTLTLGFSLALAVYRGILPDWYPSMPAAWRARTVVYLIGMSLACGVIFAGNISLVRRWRRGDATGGRLPGHWLLILGALAGWADLMALLAFFARAINGPEPDGDPTALRVFANLTRYSYFPGLVHQVVGWGLGSVFAVGLSCYAWRHVRTAWGLTFFAMAGSALMCGGVALAAIIEFWEFGRPCHVFGAYQRWGISTYRAVVLGCLALIWAAVVRDRRRQRPHDWLHWAGITAWALIAASQVATCH